MKIETKFDVNNLVVSKYQRNRITGADKFSSLLAFEVIDVNTQTCMAGTQIFYILRPIHGMIESNYEAGKRVSKYTDFHIGSSTKGGEYLQMREDELVEAPKEVIDLVLGGEQL